MTDEINDLQRRVSNTLRVGTITAINHATARATVTFGDNTVGSVPWMSGRSGSVKEWSPPAVGEQVAILSPSGELEGGFIMPGGIPSNANPPAGNAANKYVLSIPDGGDWEINVGDAKLSLSGSTLTADIDGLTFVMGAGKITFNGDVEITGGITVTNDVTAGTVSLKNHVHGGVEAGGSTTLPPTV